MTDTKIRTRVYEPIYKGNNRVLGLINYPISKFVVVGGINTVHNALWSYLFLEVMRLDYTLGFSMAFLLAMIGSFFLNSYFTFRTKPTFKKFLQFPITTLPNYIISVIGLRFLVESLSFNPFLGTIAASLIAIPITYIITKFILTRNDVRTVEAAELNSTAGLTHDSRTGGKNHLDNSAIGRIKVFLLNTFTKETGEDFRVNHNYGTLSKDDPWLDRWDIAIFLAIIAFSLLDHQFIMRSEYLWGVKSTDSTVQMIYFLPFLIKDFILGGQSWSWSYGMGGDVYSEFSYYYTTSPIVWTLAPILKFFPKTIWSLENSLNLKFIISVYKQSLFMIFMYILLRYEKRTKSASYIGAIVFGAGLYYLWNANYFDFMTDAYLWVPLMVLGFRIFQKSRNFWPLLISAALCAINNYYFAFHTYMFFIFFVIIMIVPEGRSLSRRVLNWFSQILQLGAIGISALALSAFAFIPAVYAFLKIDRFELDFTPMNWYTMDWYKNLPIKLFFTDNSLGVPMLLLLFLFLSYRRTRNITDRKVVLLILSIILFCTQRTGYVLNGLNYWSERWHYLLIFVLAYAMADFVDEMKRKNSFTPIAFLGFLLLTGYIILMRWDEVKGFNDKNLHAVVLIANIVALFAIAIRHSLKSIRSRKMSDFIVVLCVITIMATNAETMFRKNSAFDMNTETLKSEKMVSPELDDVFSRVIPKENEFYRTVFRNTEYENTPTYYRYYGISTFSSMTDGNMHRWLKNYLALRHDITYLSSFKNTDDRMYLEGLLGVKYIVAEKGTYTPPKNYKKIHSNEKYDLFEAQNYVGFDMWFDKTYPEETVINMPNYADKDVQLLNYAITEKPIDGIPQGQEINIEIIPLNENTMVYNKVEYSKESEDITENGDTKTITNEYLTFGDGGKVTFRIPDAKDNSQIYFHTYIRPDDRQGFSQYFAGKRVYKAEESNVYVYDTNHWAWEANGYNKEINWSADKRKYQIKDMMLSRVDLDSYPEVVAARNKYNMENLVVGKDKITGTVNNQEKGIMVFNIPFNKGWTLKDNGKPVELQKMNGFLTGAVLEPGEHNLVFTFRPRGLTMGIIISVIALLISALVYFLMKKFHLFRVNNPDGEKMTLQASELYTPVSENYGAIGFKNEIMAETMRRLENRHVTPVNLTPIATEHKETLSTSEPERIEDSKISIETENQSDEGPKVIFRSPLHTKRPLTFRNRTGRQQ